MTERRYTSREGYDPMDGYYVYGANGARTVRTTMPRGIWRNLPTAQQEAWKRQARQWVQRQLT